MKLCLHAAELGFTHPHTGAPLMFQSDIPEAMQQEDRAQATVLTGRGPSVAATGPSTPATTTASASGSS
jgi:hypothetical protein